MIDLPKIVTVTPSTPRYTSMMYPVGGLRPAMTVAHAAPRYTLPPTTEPKNWPTHTHDPVPIPEQPDPIPAREHGPFWRGTHE